MTLPVEVNPLLLAAAGEDGYQISRSVRLRSGVSAYFNRTPAAASNRTTWSWSGWAKNSTTQATPVLFNAYSTTTERSDFLFNNGTLDFFIFQGGNTYRLTTAAVYRDPAAWYHVVLAFDTTQATAANRIRIYVNGVQVTAFTTASYPPQNYSLGYINSANPHALGAELFSGSYVNFFDGYLTEINFIDGQALTPSSFGEFNSITGVWQPKKYTGTYGTNGFYLNFSDNSAATAAAIGKDYSGNGNNWTPNNISLTAGAAYDSMLDVPTMWADGGNGRGNYAVLNPVDKNIANIVLSNANLTATISAVNIGVRGSIGITSGKWYWEVTYTTVGGTSIFGIADAVWPLTYVGSTAASYGYGSNGNKFSNALQPAYGATFTTGDVIGIAFDASAGTLEFYKNNVSQGIAYTGIPSGVYFPAISGQTNAVLTANFGQRPFTYTPPTGFKALNTQNLPDAIIKAGNKHFDSTLYTGTGAAQSVVNAGSFQPDLVWIKSRSAATDNALYDVTRSTTKDLVSNSSAAQTTQATGLTAFNSNGFTVNTLAKLNTNLATYVAWQWKANGTPTSNTAGSITSQVSVNTTAGFSVLTFQGNSTAGATVGHGLGVAPKMIIWRSYAAGFNWVVGHQNLNPGNPWSHWMKLELTDGIALSAGPWNNTVPTSSVFTLGSFNPATTCVAFCWTQIAGYSSFGRYTGNGNADGPFTYLGFRAKYIMIKSVGAESWYEFDTSRNTYNVANLYLVSNTAAAEATSGLIDINANGFKIRSTSAAVNSNTVGYIYAAFAENPFKNALAR